MAKKVYVEENSVAKKVKKIYLGDAENVARKVKKGYIGVNGIAKLFYSSEIEALYTGNFTQEKVTMSGKEYLLLTLMSSGTLTLSDTVEADVWLCSGGSNGASMEAGTQAKAGGDGGTFKQKSVSFKEVVVTIGAAGGNSYLGDLASSVGGNAGGHGGTGATSTYGGYGGAASSKSTLPFDDGFFTKYPCAGGGGGCYGEYGYTSYNGGGGGSSTGKGSDGGSGSSSKGYGGDGGLTGGGKGGSKSDTRSYPDGQNATYYGSGGGGGGRVLYGFSSELRGSGGAGYQGVVVVRIPLS